MKPFINVFEAFGNSATSPFAVWQSAWVTGWKMMDAWQQAWLPLLAPRLPGSGLPLNPMLLFPNVAVHDLASAMVKNSPFAAMLPRVEAKLMPQGDGPGDPTRLSMRIRMPGIPGADETVAVEALIARQQGRERAALGCLQGVGVVYPPADALPLPATEPAVVAKKAAPKAAPAKKAAVKKPAAAKAAAEATPTVARKAAARKPAAKKAPAAGSPE